MIQEDVGTAGLEIWDELSQEERIWFYKRWKRARWGQSKFCTKHRLSLEKFRLFCKEMESCLKPEEEKSADQSLFSTSDSSDFCEVELTQPAQRALAMMTIELCFPNQIKARIEACEQQFGLLLREVLHATSIVR